MSNCNPARVIATITSIKAFIKLLTGLPRHFSLFVIFNFFFKEFNNLF